MEAEAKEKLDLGNFSLLLNHGLVPCRSMMMYSTFFFARNSVLKTSYSRQSLQSNKMSAYLKIKANY